MIHEVRRVDLQQRLIRGLGLKESGAASTLAPQLQAVVILDDLRSQVAAIEDRSCSGSMVGLTPTIGQFEQMQLFNPAGSNIIILVDLIRLYPSGTVGVGIYQSSTALTNLDSANNKTLRDTRFTGAGPTGELRNESTAGSPSITVAAATLVQNPVMGGEFRMTTILKPGSGINIGQRTVTLGVDAVYFEWRERGLET